MNINSYKQVDVIKYGDNFLSEQKQKKNSKQIVVDYPLNIVFIMLFAVRI